MIGLAGAHRTGKTSLARAYAEKHGWKFAQTSVSAIFKDLGMNPADSFDFETRITIQEQILIRMNEFYRSIQGNGVITDRTPLDMLAYTMADATGDSVKPEHQARFKRYTEDCYTVTNRWFSQIIVVQPGIPLVEEEGKAVLNQAYIEHLNSLIMGLCNDERLKVPDFYIPRSRVDMDLRIESVDVAKNRLIDQMLATRSVMDSRAFH